MKSYVLQHQPPVPALHRSPTATRRGPFHFLPTATRRLPLPLKIHLHRRMNHTHFPTPSTLPLLRPQPTTSCTGVASTDHITLNSDLAPVPASCRTFTAWDIASLWIGLVVGVPSYYLAGSLVDLGMSWWQGIATVTLSNLILLVPLTLAAFPGTRHGLPFPILARSAFGPRGSHFPSLLRAGVACGWFSIESWIGGQSIHLLLPQFLKPVSPSPSPSPLEFACFVAFCLAQVAIIWRGMDGIRQLEKYSAPILILLTAALLVWAYTAAGGLGRMFSLTSRLSPPEFWRIFFPSLNANISFWATVALNISDFSRYARSQRDQLLGQAGLPIFMGLFTFVGLAVTSSTETILGHIVSDPIRLLGEITGSLPAKILAIVGISLAIITTNIAANIVAPANVLVSLSPSLFTFRRGAMLTAALGVIAFQPWKLLGSSESFVYTWLLGYSALMGPIGGIMLVDYYLVKGMDLDIQDLYSEGPAGKYYYCGGYNLAAMAAMVAGVFPVVPGFLKKVGIWSGNFASGFFVCVYNNAWFVSFFVSGFVYWVLCWLQRRRLAY